MPKRKSNWTCSYCSKILKDPIDLPCGEHLIGREHLAEKDVVKENRFKCNDCNKEFQIKDNDSKSNRPFKKLIEDQSYLNEEEIGLKTRIRRVNTENIQILRRIHSK